jgi:SAM-dependent methyltransferase
VECFLVFRTGWWLFSSKYTLVDFNRVKPLKSDVWHAFMILKLVRKIFYKAIGLHPLVDRFVRYRKPREYWQKRGGDGYYREQEAVHERTLRSQFIGEEINKLPYRSLLEIGCGYGKQLQNFHFKNTFVVGCDFSRPQLLKTKELLGDRGPVLIEADAETLPFRDKTFDVVLSSAVILHNQFEKAKKIISEMIRVGRKYLVHNEDTDITFSRYGYDMRKTYVKMGFKIVKSIMIPCTSDPSITQFAIVELTSPDQNVKSEDVALEYH